MFIHISFAVETAEIFGKCRRGKRVTKQPCFQHFFGNVLPLFQAAVGCASFDTEHDYFAKRQLAFAVASPRRLGNAVQPRHRPINARKIQIHAGFNQLRADQPQGLVQAACVIQCQISANQRNHFAAVRGAHIGGQMQFDAVRRQGGK